MVGLTAMLTLVLAGDQSSWMMSSVPQVPASYWSVLAGQSCHTTVSILLMLVWGVEVICKDRCCLLNFLYFNTVMSLLLRFAGRLSQGNRQCSSSGLPDQSSLGLCRLQKALIDHRMDTVSLWQPTCKAQYNLQLIFEVVYLTTIYFPNMTLIHYGTYCY